MPIEKERLDAKNFTPPWVKHEHYERYMFASRFVNGKTVVDCACGTGEGTKLFASNGANQVLAFDLSAITISDSDNRIKFTKADATNLPLPDKIADVYISLETIEHLQDDRKFLSEAKRVLKPEGVFICSTPNRTVTNPGSTISDQPFNRFHLREYSQKEFIELLKIYFSHVEIFGQNPQPMIVTKIKAILSLFLPSIIIARLFQLFKIPQLLFDNPKQHRVSAVLPKMEYEYLIVVCH